MDQSGPSGSNVETRAPPAKRLRMEMIPGNASPATRAASAVNLESDEVPEMFKCPICQKLPLGHVYQCANGHLLCSKCQVKQKRNTCVKCKAVLKASSGELIRCRPLESILDALLIACPYKSNGCQEVLARGQVETHKKDCVHNGNCVQICQYFGGSGTECQYWSQVSRPERTLEHLNSHLDFATETRNHFCLGVDESRFKEEYVGAVVTRQHGDVFLTTMWWSHFDDQILSFACLQLNKPTVAHRVQLTFEGRIRHRHYSVSNLCTRKPMYMSSTRLDRKWKLTLPATPILDASAVLEHKPVSVARPFLENHLLRDEAGQKVKLRRHDKGMVKITVKIL